ncbi:hypothetical protein GCM10010176_079040 [Nonomuraea spiralis]|nr:hypothetical protein GCM10010176_079040 [Nonomuraea spiralis]
MEKKHGDYLLMQAVIAEAAARGQAELDLVSVDSTTTTRTHRHAAAMVLDGELSAALEEAVEQERGATPKAHNAPDGDPGNEENRDNDDGDEDVDKRDERRRLRRRYRFRLKAAKLGRSWGA